MAKKHRPSGSVRKDLWRIPALVFESEAFASLSAVEIKILIGFYRRLKWDKRLKRYLNDKDLVYTKACMAYEGHCSGTHALSCRDKLLQVGFIDLPVQVEGRVYGGYRPCNIYEISDRYLKWHPDAEVRQQNKFKEHPPLRVKPAPKTAFKSNKIKQFPDTA